MGRGTGASGKGQSAPAANKNTTIPANRVNQAAQNGQSGSNGDTKDAAAETERLRLEQEQKDNDAAAETERLRLEQEQKDKDAAAETERLRLEQEQKDKDAEAERLKLEGSRAGKSAVTGKPSKDAQKIMEQLGASELYENTQGEYFSEYDLAVFSEKGNKDKVKTHIKTA